MRLIEEVIDKVSDSDNHRNSLPYQKAQHVGLMHPLTRPSIILVGHPKRVDDLYLNLENSGLVVKRAKYMKELKTLCDGTEAGVVFVFPMNRGKPESLIRNLTKHGAFRDLPIFAVVSGRGEEMMEGHLYQAGFRLVLKWPREKNRIAGMLSQIIASGSLDVQSGRMDHALERAIQNRVLANFGTFGPKVKTKVSGGVAFLAGEVRSVSRRRKLLKSVRQTPGIQGVSAEFLKIKPTDLKPKQVVGMANEIIKSEPGVSDKTIDVKLNRGDVRITGTVSDISSASHLKQEIEKIEGVSSVKNQVVVSKRQQSKDEKLARRVARIVKKVTLSGSGNVQVKVLNGVAHLEGWVKSVMDSVHIERAVRSVNGVKGLRNKLAYERSA